jgi:predicted AAA+ superfamily ATPase
MYSSFYWFSVDKGTKNTEHFLYSRKTDLYMDLLQRNHQLLLKGINCTFLRYLHARIEWEDRLIGIFGSRGVGKTTLLLQHIKLKFEDSREALYVNLDDFWFETHSLTDAVKEFLQAGGHYLFLDEIHFYSGWMEEVSTLLDANPALKIVFATTSLYSQTEVRNGLRHEAAFYVMHPMSFREFLSYESILDKDPIPLEDILANHHDLVKEINAEMNIVPIYRNYLEHGCYPFYWQDPDMYYFRLQELVRKEICRDLPSVVSISMSNLERAQKYFMMVAESAPLRPKSIDVTRKINMLRQQSDSLLRFFHDMRLIYYSADQLGTTPAKQKVFMGDTNLLISFFGDKENRQLMCETYFLSQMRSVANVEFLIGGKYIFAVGDPLRGYDRLRFVPDAYAAIYGLPKSVFNRMPAWILGFSY